MDTQTYDSAKARKAQDEYCEREYKPHFAPRMGFCFLCGRDIYSEGGISVEMAGTRLVTGCPFCHISYCD